MEHDRKPRILIVADDIFAGAELKSRLEALGHAVCGASVNGEPAVRAAEIDLPDIVLMDLGSGEERAGIESAGIIRERYDIPVVFITAPAGEDRLKSAKPGPPFGYLVKPYQDRDLKITIEMALYAARMNADRKRAEGELAAACGKLEALWGIASLVDAGVKGTTDHILASIIRMTGSEYGFYGIVNEDESAMIIHSWSGEAMKDCSMSNKQQHFPIKDAGIWAEAVRRRAPFILNDYAAAHPAKIGLPEGHVRLSKLLVVPSFSRGRVASVAAVANRAADYDRNDIDQITAFLNSIHMVVEHRRAEEALVAIEDRLQSANDLMSGVLDYTPMMAVFLNTRFDFIWVNRAYAESCRHDPSFFPGKNHFDLYPHEENQAIFQRVVDTGEPFFVAAKPFVFPDQPERGVTYWDWSLIPIKNKAGAVTGLVFSLAEVTDRFQTQEKLKKALLEKEALLKEVHHRVKNNMQVISSLLNLQLTTLKNGEGREAIRDSQGRILSMALIHEMLYQTENLSSIELEPYVSRLVNALMDAYAKDPDKIRIRLAMGPIFIGINQAPPLGLILTELVTNALKYAFPEGRKGQILVAAKLGDSQVEITVSDNGVGFPAGFDWRVANSLGLKLVRMLTEVQLAGTIGFNQDAGTTFTVRIPIDTSG